MNILHTMALPAQFVTLTEAVLKVLSDPEMTNQVFRAGVPSIEQRWHTCMRLVTFLIHEGVDIVNVDNDGSLQSIDAGIGLISQNWLPHHEVTQAALELRYHLNVLTTGDGNPYHNAV